jgi:hypothetical protein
MSRERKHGAVRLRRVLKYAGPLLLAVSPGAWSQAPQQQEQPEGASWGVDVGARYTDNVGRVDVNEESETVGIAGAYFAFTLDRPRLDGHAAADLHYEEYFDSTFDSRVNGGLDGLMSFAFVPERFLWTVEDNYGQVARNRQAVDTPDNRQDINYFSTGPDITLPFGSRTYLELSGRWEDAYFEDTDQDSETRRGSAAVVRELSSATSVSVNGAYSEIEFDQADLFPGFEVTQAFLRLALTGSRTTLSLDGGASRVEQQDGASKSESLLARLDLTRRVGARSLLHLEAGREPSSTAQDFRRAQQLGGVTIGPDGAVPAGDSFLSDYGYLSFTTDWERSVFTVLLSARAEDHERFSVLDREQYRAAISYSRDMTRNISLDVHGAYLDEKLTETGFSFDELGGGLGMRWQLSRHFSLIARADHYVGSSDDGARDYTENRAYFGIRYSSERSE